MLSFYSDWAILQLLGTGLGVGGFGGTTLDFKTAHNTAPQLFKIIYSSFQLTSFKLINIMASFM